MNNSFLTVVLKNRFNTLLYFIFINLPLIIFTFNTTNWSDDYQLTNLIAIKAKFSPFWATVLEPTGGDVIKGGHFAPVYNLFNILIGFVTLNPIFFHFVVWICFVLTAFFIFLIGEKYFKDNQLGLLAGSLFAVNYYIAFKALNWNTFHSHATNTFTGVVSLYLLLKFFENKSWRTLVGAAIFLLLSIYNYESGFIFYPVLIFTAFYLCVQKKIQFKQFGVVFLVLTFVLLLFPIGSRLVTGKSVPLAYRFKLHRDIQNYAFITNDLFFKSLGFSILYNKTVFNPLKDDLILKESMIKLLRGHDMGALQEISPVKLLGFVIVGLLTLLLLAFLSLVAFKKLRPEMRLFVWLYAIAFFVFIIVFYRVDIANAVAIFSCFIIADIILSYLRSPQQFKIGLGLIVFYVSLTAWTIVDRFDDCYQKSFFGISSIAVKGPDHIYRELNKQLGHMVGQGIVWFTHDYSMYHRTSGFERIGDMIGVDDFICFNAAVFYDDLKKTKYAQEYKNKSLNDLILGLTSNSKNMRIIVGSQEEAVDYIKSHQDELVGVDAFYISKDYKVTRLQALLNHAQP